MIRLLWLSLSLTWRDRYPKNILLLIELITSALDVAFYFYTSEAFGKVFGSENYFQYVMWGELITAIPMTLMLLPTRSLRNLIAEGNLDILRTCPRPLWQILLLLDMGEFFRQLIRTLFISTLALAMGLSLSPLLALKTAILIALSAPLFWSLGLTAAALFIYFGRGLGALQHLNHLLVVLAGVYFPLQVLPAWLADLSFGLSPLTWLLQALRSDTDFLQPFIKISIITILILPLSGYLMKQSLLSLKKSGRRLHLLN